jgi:serine/threonine protein kinase/Flp pilus assembly protein TadD
VNGSSEKSIFLSALEHEQPADRDAYVREACGDDPQLRVAVEGLLAAHERPDNPLDHVPEAVSPIRLRLEIAEGIRPETTAAAQRFGSPGPERPPGTIVGPYKLLEMIGEGGFGLVYVAEQQQPVRRRVALKLIKPGMDSREVTARFEAERQALAMMDHPNIAHVFDAGATREGQPYFVMELVRGIPLTHFCDKNRLTTRERLELFIDICNAVQHAHQKGVIHRDLKPSNVLVTLHDGTPVVKVIDFGVAKAISEPLTDKTLYTRFAQMIGTPLYMSPEQAEMSGLDVDTRSDIYSLGVMLYELLTGATPFDSSRFRTVAFDELRRIIREEEPPRPSTRLTTLGLALSTVSTNRRIEPRALSTMLRGDLDWIAMKALEKDRRRRYATAAELADDVRRFLTEQPIAARPPSLAYQFGKLARRNKVALTTASLVLVALVLGTAVSVWQAIQATSARAEADSLRQKAEDFSDRLKEANVLLDNARANADEGNYRLAQTEYTKAAQLQPAHYLVWSGRGSLYVRLGLWHLAAKDYAKALQLGAPANNPSWWGIPQLCLYAGETAAYDTACRTLRRQLERSSDPFFVALAIRSCVVAPNSVGDAKALAERATRLSTDLPSRPSWPGFFAGGPSGPGQGPPPTDKKDPAATPRVGNPKMPDMRLQVMQYVAGLAQYRAGNAPQAIELLESTFHDDPHWPARAIGYPALAMAYHRAGRTREASETLDKAKAALDDWTTKLAEGSLKSLPLPWFDFIECIVLTREANELIRGQPLADDPRLAAFERKALAAIEVQ